MDCLKGSQISKSNPLRKKNFKYSYQKSKDENKGEFNIEVFLNFVEKVSKNEENKINTMLQNLKISSNMKSVQEEKENLFDKIGQKIENNFSKTLNDICLDKGNDSLNPSNLSFKTQRINI